MTLIVNGQEQDCPDGLSLTQFIDQLGLKADRVAVELNRSIAPRARWSEIQLAPGDKLEIVHFVGGGSPVVSLRAMHSECPAATAYNPHS